MWCSLRYWSEHHAQSGRRTHWHLPTPCEKRLKLLLVVLSRTAASRVAQAIDLRRRDNPALKIGTGSGACYQGLRAIVPFLDHDRALTPDIDAAANWLRSSAGP